MKQEWEVDKPAKCITECGHLKEEAKHEIIFSTDVWNVIQVMCKKFPEHEWQMMLSGSVEKDVCYITGYYITKQEVSAALVTNKDCVDTKMIEEKSLVAAIHSHVNMGTSPSGTDIDDSVMSLIDYHIIVNNSLEMNGMRKAKLPCGSVAVAKCDVFIENATDLNKLVIEGIDRIEKKTYGYAGHGLTGYEMGAWKGHNNKKWEDKWMRGRTYENYEEYDKEVAQRLMENGCY